MPLINNSKYFPRTHKYIIQVPKRIKDAEDIDMENVKVLVFSSLKKNDQLETFLFFGWNLDLDILKNATFHLSYYY